MSIVTRCPGCGTTFRVTPVQLQAQHGMVRCGRCAQVFDGFKTLSTLPEPALETPPQALQSPPETLAPSAAPMPPAPPVLAPPNPAVPAAVTAAPPQVATASEPVSTPKTAAPP